MSKTTKTSGRPRTVVFFGSGPVAAASLALLLEHQSVEAIITKPTTEHQMRSVGGDIPVFTVSKRPELDELIKTQQFSSNMGVLIDFGIIVSQGVIDYFELGIINSHFSILPEWRGADPISFAILSGQASTGVSLMVLTAGMDEGPLLSYDELPLTGTETTPTLTESLIDLSDALLRHELPGRFSSPTEGAPQSTTGRTESYSRKLAKDDGIINWSKSAVEIEREIRAFIEWPKSRCTLASKDVVITSASISDKSGNPGEIVATKNELGIFCGSGCLIINTLKPSGKKEMPASAFLAGYRSLL